MKVILLTALGCMFWLLLLAGAASLFWRYGFYEDGFGFNYDSLPLLGVPAVMLPTTLTLGYFAKRRRVPSIAFFALSVLAFVAAFYWLAVWGKGV